jgi:hypothetical protein
MNKTKIRQEKEIEGKKKEEKERRERKKILTAFCGCCFAPGPVVTMPSSSYSSSSKVC